MPTHPSPSPARLAPLASTDAGTGGPALLFVPGWCGDRSVFDGLLVRAAAHRRAVSVDLPDHGESPAPGADFGSDEVVDALVDLVLDAGLERVVPVGLSHAGWAAIELRRRLGAERVPGVVLLDWMVLGTPPGFADALAGLQGPAWAEVRRELQAMWSTGVDVPALHDYVASMGAYGATHWSRAGREIAASFAAAPVPLDVLAALQPCPTLHLYAQPATDDHLAAQREYAAEHPWFSVCRVDARSHFPMFEVPDQLAAAIEAFTRGLG
jgi:pimeloyl-ACP methyl ester carboxylesterase